MCENKGNKRVVAIILAAGLGSRVGAEVTKQRIKICGHTVLWHTLRAFQSCEAVDGIVVVVRADERAEVLLDIGDSFSKIHAVINGGKCRAESAALGFNAIPEGTDIIAIHDGARCLITPRSIERVVLSALEKGAATAVSAVTDTVKTVDSEGKITATLDRSVLRCAQTPQVFSKDIYGRALKLCADMERVTDDNMLVESIGEQVYAVDIEDENLKITTARDLGYAEFVISKRSGNDV